MKQRVLLGMTVVGLIATSAMLTGCAQKAASSSDAIQHAKALKTPQEQANYLVSQAKAFLSSKEYQEAIKIAQHVLSNIDSNSQAAQDILERAKTQLASAAQGAVKDLKKQFGQ